MSSPSSEHEFFRQICVSKVAQSVLDPSVQSELPNTAHISAIPTLKAPGNSLLLRCVKDKGGGVSSYRLAGSESRLKRVSDRANHRMVPTQASAKSLKSKILHSSAVAANE